jgi:hypothetical protein
VSGPPHVIEIRLNSASEMFELAPTDRFGEFRNYLTGVEMCLSDLRSGSSRRPVRLVVSLPESEVDGDTGRHIARTLRGFCDQRLAYNRSEGRALRFDGLSALRIGVPIAVVGLTMTAWVAARGDPSSGMVGPIVDHLGWVLAWLGLWFPLDVFFFYPLQYQRESRSLERLRAAEVEVRNGEAIVPT